MTHSWYANAHKQAETRRIAARYEEDAQHSAVIENRIELLRTDTSVAVQPLRVELANVKASMCLRVQGCTHVYVYECVCVWGGC